MRMRNSVGKILRKCHINSKYKGYLYIQESIAIMSNCIENDKLTPYITKDVYPVIAHKYNSSLCSVEAAIRNSIGKCWENNNMYVQEILGYKTSKCPSNTEFLNAIIYYMTINEQVRDFA